MTIATEAGVDPAQLPMLGGLVQEALPALARWGGLIVPTRIVVVPDHAALERAIDRPGYDWLRAWARYDVVYLQAPASWGAFGLGLGLAPGRGELRDLLTHELAHCAMYQAVSDGSDWSQKEIPLWFREGLASWTAHQAGKRLSRSDLAARLRAEPNLDPLRDGERLSRREEPVVYAAAHWGFGLLLTRGEPQVHRLLTLLRAGAVFPEAFAEVYGQPQASFERELLAALGKNTDLASR